MISSLISKFNRNPGRVLYLTGNNLTAYEWSKGGLTDAYIFQAGEEGLTEFSVYLQESPSIPAYFLVDIVEEEYRRDSIPHVFGNDRKSLIEARVKRLFRDVTYTAAIIQGRETEGRKDDLILYSALTNPERLSPWIDRLNQYKVPLGGIYSLPVLSEELLSYVEADSDQVLLVSLQGEGSMRQTFFQDGHLKISRLAHLPARGPQHISEAVFDEVEKLRRYLGSLRLLERNEQLEVIVLMHGDAYDYVNSQIQNSNTVKYRLIDVADIAAKIKMPQIFVNASTDSLFAQLLMKVRPKNHYATKKETLYFSLHRLRYAMQATSLLLIVGGVFWSAMTLIDAQVLEKRANATQQQANYFKQRFEQAKEGLPELPVEANDLKNIVESAEKISEGTFFPNEVMGLLSQVLDDFQSLRIERLDWRPDTDPNALIGEERASDSTRNEAARNRFETELDIGTYQLVFIRGEVFPFDGNYRNALNMVHLFVDRLSALSEVKQVRILSLPLNVNSNQSLSGDVAARLTADKASFSLRIIIKVKNDEA